MSGHRNCAVFGCGNSGARLKKWMSIPCSVHECNQGTSQCDCAPPFTLFPFPTQLHDSERRQQWIKLVNRKDEKGRNWQPKSDSRICSIHFPEGRPTIQNPNPTINLGYTSVANSKKERKRPLVRETTPLTKKACHEKSTSESPALSYDEPSAPPHPQNSDKIDIPVHHNSGTGDNSSQTDVNTQANNNCICNDNTMKSENNCHRNDKNVNIISAKENEIHFLKKLVEKERREVAFWRKKFVNKQPPAFSAKLLNTDKKIKTFLGLPNKAAFEVLFKLLEKKAPKIKYWQGPKKYSSQNRRNFSSTPKKSGPRRLLSVKDELILTLMKLRLGSLNADLAVRFQISETTVSKVINSWFRFLAKELKCLIYNLSKDIALQHLPKKFNNAK